MTKKISSENNFLGFEFLPAQAITNCIEIYHPFDLLAKEYFSNKNLNIESLDTGSIKIYFEDLTKEEKENLSKEIKKFLKDSRQKIIKEFLIYKKGTNYL